LQLRCTALPLPRARRSLRDPRKERWSLKLTRHNGRAGKHGTYNPKHNDRSFEIANSEHIDPERVQQNIYWDCYNGIRSALHPKSEDSLADTFEEVEKLYYKLHYTNFTEKQNERNAKIRHTERNRSTEDLLTSKKTCPEESIYQLGTLESHASPKELFQIATEFMDEFHERFGKHVHILDWALHLDEGTPHIHERHVFDCENKYGEIAPQQEKALEALGFELPKPDKPLGRYNNRKITFDAACRTMLFEIAKRHGLELDEVPEYGGQAYLEKQDYILKRQNERIAEQKKELQEQSIQYVGLLEDCRNQRDEYAELFNQAIRQSEEILKNNEKIKSQENELEELFSQWVDVNDLFNDAVNGSYDQAVLAVSDVGLNKALQETVNEIDQHLEWLMEPERIADFRTRKYAEEQLKDTDLCLISLGAYGGYITVGFDHTVPNVPGEYDLKIYGNAYYDMFGTLTGALGGSAEPGIVLVSKDTNGNGLADDEWYELAGSEYNSPATTKNYTITYYRPSSPKEDVKWTDNKGNEGYVYRNDYHTTNSYYPAWIKEDQITFHGSRLKDNTVNEPHENMPEHWVGYCYAWGYADNHPNGEEQCKFKIDWAVDKNGNPVVLDGIDFVRIYTAVNQNSGWMGEISTELQAVEDLHFKK